MSKDNAEQDSLADQGGQDDPAREAQEEGDATQGPLQEADENDEPNDPEADRIAKHGEPPEEELAAQQANVVGMVQGVDRGPSQDDLNPAYAVVTDDPPEDEDEGREAQEDDSDDE